ncbi:hypothetical protein [Alkalihalobacterium sp. APHAB7]|uniref:hypothetical protein n=1 Tax=Alkalihalobacterium sp. APHAB7 TaxID=3402081 RepID=UPI003AADAD93
MSKKIKNIFRISIILNLLLIAIVAWGVNKNNYVIERVLTMNVAYNLFWLEEKISHQSDNDWSDPSLVTAELKQIFDGIYHSLNVGSESRTLSNSDKETLENLIRSLQNYQRYPMETLDSYSDLTEEDKKDYEELGVILREVGFVLKEMNDFGYWEKNSLIKKFGELSEKINAQ